jgi:hypothetical protein
MSCFEVSSTQTTGHSVVRSLINLQHILHTSDERSIGVRRDNPLLLQVRPEDVFLSVRPIVLSLARSTILRSTTGSSSNCNVHRLRPLGGSEQAKRSTWPRWLRQGSAAWPMPANACGPARPRTLTPPVAGGSEQPCRCRYRIRLSLHPSPASEASVFNRMRALVSSRAGCLPACIMVLSRSRSSSLSFTTYLFTAICFALTNHLRHCGAIESGIPPGNQ